MLELIVAVAFAVLISAGCSLFEAVLYAVPRRHVEAMAQSGKSAGRIFRDLRGNVDRPIAAILSLNTIANTAGAAFAGSAASAVFGHEWLGYFSAFFTLVILVFSEIIPKTAGVLYGTALLPVVAHPLKGLVWVMTPVIWMCGLVTRLISGNRGRDTVTAGDILVMARMSLREGAIQPYQEQIIERILGLEKKRVKDVMTPRTVIFSLSEHLTLEETARLGIQWEHSRFPVYDETVEDVVGIVLTKELLVALSEGKKETALTDLMRPVHFVVETAGLDRVLTEFLKLRQHLFVVLDEYGGLAGLITLEDILEEILGREIVDESDRVVDKRALARERRKMTVRNPRKRGGGSDA